MLWCSKIDSSQLESKKSSVKHKGARVYSAIFICESQSPEQKLGDDWMTGKELKSLWKQGRASLGYTSVSSDQNVALIAGRAGFDWMLIDQTHAPRNVETVAAIIQSAKRTPTCRATGPPAGVGR